MSVTDPTAGNRVFISCVTKEFEDCSGPFQGFRSRIAKELRPADCEVEVQEDFRQTDEDTVEKLDLYIRKCAAVIHLIGSNPGAKAHPKAVAAYLQAVPDFLHAHPEVRTALGDFSDLTYTQWEAFMALHHGVALRVYVTPEGRKVQANHLERLRHGRKYPSDRLIVEPADLAWTLIGDLRYIIPSIPQPQQRLSPPKFIHHAAEHFLGREPQLKLLDEAWTNGTNVLSIIAWGGVGKTALLTEWVQTRFIDHHWKDEGQFAPTTSDVPAGQKKLAGGAAQPRSGEAEPPDPAPQKSAPQQGRENAPPALAAYFDWTFYDQGTRSLADGTEARTGSVGDFFEQALVFFGDPDPNLPGKGRRLADLIRQQRSLIILDGLEPLQQPPGHPQAGRLLDPDLRDLLAALAQSNPGLCLITSRQALTDLHSLRRTVHVEHELEDLPVAIAIQLLRELQIKGTDQELAEASEKFGCHALSLTLLGRYLFDAHPIFVDNKDEPSGRKQFGDIARIDRIRDLQRADTLTREDRHRTAWRILETYESWLATAQADGNPKTLAVLRLTGLFDRTATADCLAALRAEPIIPGLTDAICGMADDEWNILLKRLERAHLIKLRESSNLESPDSVPKWAIAAHPLICGFFADQVKRARSEAWHLSHQRLYEHLCTATTDKHQPTLEDLQPLYQAVAHGCQAGQSQDALRIYQQRILIGEQFYSSRKLGAYRSNLGSLAHFFNLTQPFAQCDSTLPLTSMSWLLNEAAFCFRACGEPNRAQELAIEAVRLAIKNEQWNQAAESAINLSETQISLGQLKNANDSAKSALALAQRPGGNLENQRRSIGVMAESAYLTGDMQAAELSFQAVAELLATHVTTDFRHSFIGYLHCDFLLAEPEIHAWLRFINLANEGNLNPVSRSIHHEASSLTRCQEILVQAQEACNHFKSIPSKSRLIVGLNYLIVSQASLYKVILNQSLDLKTDLATQQLLRSQADEAVDRLRNSNSINRFPASLLTRAWQRSLNGARTGPDSAQADLDEAWEIAERGPMPLFLADIHLHRARLFGYIQNTAKAQSEGGGIKKRRQKGYPWHSPQHDLAEARRLIEKHGYWRRKEELEDAEAAAIHW